MKKAAGSSYINHFLQPDTIVPDWTNPQSLNRYAYTLGNPLKYTDPSGHDPIIFLLILGATAIAGALLSGCSSPSPQEQIQSAIDTAQSSGKSEDYQAAIDLAVNLYDIDTANMKGGKITYNPAFTDGSGRITPDGIVEIGPYGFDGGARDLVDTVAHESVHVEQLMEGRYYLDEVGYWLNEYEAYSYVINNKEKYDLDDLESLTTVIHVNEVSRDQAMDNIERQASRGDIIEINISIGNGSYTYSKGKPSPIPKWR